MDNVDEAPPPTAGVWGVTGVAPPPAEELPCWIAATDSSAKMGGNELDQYKV